MSVKALLAAAIVVSVPIAVYGAEPSTAEQKVSPAKKVCRTHTDIGSRLANVRVCRTRAEEEEARQERRRVIDRIQSNKVSFGK